jgi:hypothetical protein
MMTGLKYLNQKEASKIDELLMGEKLNYSIYQLMELAGLGLGNCYKSYISNWDCIFFGIC